MASAEDRERWLKRILPALAISVAYFTFAKGYLEDSSRQAQEQWQSLIAKGISAQALAARQAEMESLDQKLADSAQKRRQFEEQLLRILGQVEAGSDFNHRLEELHAQMLDHGLQLIAEQEVAAATLTPALRELDTLVHSEALQNRFNLHTWQIQCLGRYAKMHEFLQALAARQDRFVIPLSLTMQPPQDDNELRMFWTLTLWI